MREIPLKKFALKSNRKVFVFMTKVYPKLGKNPIKEAVFCVDLSGLPSLSSESTIKIMESFDPSYVKESDQIAQSLSFDLKAPDKAVVPTQFWRGTCFKNGDKRLLLMNLDQQIVRFSFSQLPMYLGWDPFIADARKLFDAFVSVTRRNPFVKRLGIRFINAIDMPNGTHELCSLLRNVPQDPANMKNISVDDFLYKETNYYKDYDLKATAIRTVQYAPDGHPLLLFDNDVFSNPDMEYSQMRWDDLLHRAHELKNDIFFGSITEECLAGIVAK